MSFYRRLHLPSILDALLLVWFVVGWVVLSWLIVQELMK